MLAKLKDFDLQSENQGNLQEGGYFVGGRRTEAQSASQELIMSISLVE